MGQINKMQNNINTTRFMEKSDYIKENINEKLSGNNVFDHIGITKNIMYNAIKQNILKDGTNESIEVELDAILNKKRANVEELYGENIKEKKQEMLKVLNKLYQDENINQTLTDTLNKNKSQRWIQKFVELGKIVGNSKDLSKDQFDNLNKFIEENKLNLDVNDKAEYVKRNDISEKEANIMLQKCRYEGVLTLEKAEMMFSNMSEPFSPNFRKWFLKHEDEIMMNGEYYSKIATLHNDFEYMLKDPANRTLYDNGKLSVNLAMEKINGIMKDVKDGKDENAIYWNKVNQVGNISIDEAFEGEKIYEITKEREGTFIPNSKVTEKRYRGRLLSTDDPLNILVGNATDCCQRVGGTGQGAMEHGSTSKNGRIFVVEEIDNEGNPKKIVVQSWVWRNKMLLVLIMLRLLFQSKKI